jgi:hypothetical protein
MPEGSNVIKSLPSKELGAVVTIAALSFIDLGMGGDTRIGNL